MEYFSLLGTVTAIIVILAWILFRRQRDVGLLAGIGALYYWSLYGAWSVVIDKTGGFSGQHYYYLEQKMFPVVLDGWYLITLAAYAGFIILVELTLLATLTPQRPRPAPRLVLRHEAILLLGFLAGVASFLLMRSKLNTAWLMNTSAYWYTRSQTDEWFTLHQVLNRVALIPPAIGLATLAAGTRSRYFVNIVRPYTWLAYLLLLAGMGAFTFILGNKNEVFTALLAGALAYAGSLRKPDWKKLGLSLACGLWFLAAIDFFRATPLSGMREALEQRAVQSMEAGRFVASSNEAFAAHFSLYGVLASHTELRFGYSLYSLACSVIPRVLWRERPRDIYLYYAESVGAMSNQGYSLHHATGWYLNFGYAGVAIGAIVLGFAWAGCLNAHRRVRRRSGLLFRLFGIIAPWVLVAGIPPLIRAGPEGYKGLLLECFLIPMAVLMLACRPAKSPGKSSRKRKLIWQADRGWALEGAS